jgi:Xaa-Pro aminopeptidase
MQIHDMGNRYAARVEAIRETMREHGWDAVVLTGGDPHGSEYPADRWKQVEWVSGFTGEAGDLVITLDHAGLWTDTRYFIQAVRQLAGTGIELHRMRVPEQVPIPQWLAAYEFPSAGDESVVCVAVDGLCQRVGDVAGIEAAFAAEGERSVRIVSLPDLLSPLWTDRPEIPCGPVMTLGTEQVGESREQKLSWIRKFLLRKGCDAILLTALDEIAWLLNVRGADIAFNPLVISYLLVTLDSAEWYVKKYPFTAPDAESLDSFYELQADGVVIKGYDELELTLSGLSDSEPIERLYVDPSTLNYHIYKQIQSSVMEGPSPVPLRKAVKNAVETEGMREAHLEDGLAMEKFLFSLERALSLGEPVTERLAADRLDALRAAIPGYRGNSFDTISAYGENAALPHYVTPPGGGAVLRPRGLYLVDSGGQYLFGTTDLTRTVPLGPCTPLEREDYTLVLKGHIQLAKAVFPAGTAGCQLDVLARNALWSSKRNFGHGTGHGVGFFLCVHEGPQDIRQNFNNQPLLPGMITSDEPGIYREGMHGVRHENLVLCVDAGTNEFGAWRAFETLTLCHFDTSALVPGLLAEDERAWLNAYQERVYRELAPRLPAEIAGWLREKTRPV